MNGLMSNRGYRGRGLPYVNRFTSGGMFFSVAGAQAAGANHSCSGIGWLGSVAGAKVIFAQEGTTPMAFRIRGLPAENFTHLFDLSDADLAAQGGVRRTVDGKYPCRVSLTDSQPGEGLLLINYEHHPVSSPYRMRFAIFVREGDQTYDKVNEVPDQLRSRILAVRSFDAKAMMVDNKLVDGNEIEPVLEKLLALPNVDYLHIHFAAAGCYAAKVERA
jgi:Protein of unknown function (DUF1203)